MAADFADFSFELPGADETKRRAYRVPVRGVSIKVHGFSSLFPVVDLSVTGLAFRDDSQSFTLGQLFQFDLFIKDKVWVNGVEGKVVRTWNKAMVGCSFAALTRSQEQMLDRLNLEIQKRMIDKRKKKPLEDNATEPEAS